MGARTKFSVCFWIPTRASTKDQVAEKEDLDWSGIDWCDIGHLGKISCLAKRQNDCRSIKQRQATSRGASLCGGRSTPRVYKP